MSLIDETVGKLQSFEVTKWEGTQQFGGIHEKKGLRSPNLDKEGLILFPLER